MMLPVIMCYMLLYMAFYFLHQFTDVEVAARA